LPVPRPYKRAVSAGDIAIAAGVCVAAAEIFLRQRRNAGAVTWRPGRIGAA
jgi:hypothetical protein